VRDFELLRELDFELLLEREPVLRVAMRAFVSNDRACAARDVGKTRCVAHGGTARAFTRLHAQS